MIQLPDIQELEALKNFHENYCLTIYLPMAEPAATIDSYRIQIKNVLKEGKRALIDAGLSLDQAEDMLRPTRLLLEEYEARQCSQGGVALFIHPKMFRYYCVPDHSLPYVVTVSGGFNVEPLQQVIERDHQYYVLMLGHRYVRLYEGSHFDIKPVTLKDFPADMNQALRIDEYPHYRELHTIAPVNEGKGSKAYHEQYDASKVDKELLLEFFRWVDRRLHNFLIYHERPLIIAGVKYLMPIYRKANTYSGLVDTPIIGNQDIPDLRIIKQKAWSLINA